MNIDLSNMVGLDAAVKELDALEAAESSSQNQAGQSVNSGQDHAAQDTVDPQQPKSDGQSDTPSTTDQQDQKVAEAKESTTPADTAKEPSRFAKAKERQEKSWAQLNADKEALAKEREAAAKERDAIKAEREAWQAERAKAEGKYTPEQYDAAATRFEAEGKFDLADAARAKAADLRKNPPKAEAPNAKVEAEKFNSAMKEWMGKAAVDFPAIAKADSPEAVALKKFVAEEPQAMASPKGLYYAARMITAETAAARVPVLTKELEQLRAKVKGLEELTAPGGEGRTQTAPADKPWESMSDADQLASLQRQAAELGVIR